MTIPSGFPFAVIKTEVFPVSYEAARQRWLAQISVLSVPAKHRPYRCRGAAPDGGALFTDTVWIGDEKARKVVVVAAGTHGVEGFAGSAVQIDLLHFFTSGKMALPAGTALLLIHALTPWGYAWLRRCDEDGVDLNRNMVDFSRHLPENRGYDRLRYALFLADAGQRNQIFAEFEREYGRTALEKAISGGQYNDPDGPFYGGRKPAHGRLITEDLIETYSLAERDLAVIDVHTGLGPYGYGEIICDHAPDSPGTSSALRCYGDSVTLPLLGTSSSVPKNGLLDYAWHRIMNERSCYVTLEFGTYSTDRLFEVLLRDHQLWAEPDNREQRQEHSRQMRRHFCPDDRAWKELVLFRARQVVDQALKGL
ncbi:MAG: DUF2817 domain-containing protein [Gammaproteobacteria bacterium]